MTYWELCRDCQPDPERLCECCYHDITPCFCELAVCTSEMEMQRAGRPSENTFRDLRSARKAHQRTIKRPRKKRICKQDWIWGYWGYEKNGRHIQQCADARNYLQQREWEWEYLDKGTWEWELKFLDPSEHFAMYGTWADGEAVGDGGDAEDFGVWGRRRINEMRSVKEDRIRKKQAVTTCTPDTTIAKLSTPSAIDKVRSVPTTTLPTDPMDIRGHELLEWITTPTACHLKQLQRWKKPFFPSINGFCWFGEYSWAYHRNASGCWEFGRGECSGGAIPCLCCASPRYDCHCEQFVGQPSPEDVQRCVLVEWAKGELRVVLERQYGEEMERDNELDFVSDVEEDAWEFMSDAVSMDWSFVSEQGMTGDMSL